MNFNKDFERDLQTVRAYCKFIGRDVFVNGANYTWPAWAFLCVIGFGFLSCTYTMVNYDVATIFTAAIVMFGFFQVSYIRLAVDSRVN